MEPQTEAPAQPAAKKKPALSLKLSPVLIVAVVGVVAVIVMAVWKSMAVSAVEERLTAEKTQAVQQAQAEAAKAVEEGKKAVLGAQREKLILFAKPLAWALRDQVMADNQKQIDGYIGELVKLPGFDHIVLARTDGSIALASDRKMIDGKLESVYPAEVSTAQAPTVLDGEGGKLILAVPVMGLSEKLALLVLTFDPAAPPQAAAPAAPAAIAPPTQP
jgi:type II secretory pathway pseudopilin PulG